MRHLFSFAFAALLTSTIAACGGPPTPQNEGEGCGAFEFPYTCDLTQSAILVCSESNIWEREATCDAASDCSINEPEGATQVCCTVEGQSLCLPEGGGQPEDNDTIG